jgi:hypothetical protein
MTSSSVSLVQPHSVQSETNKWALLRALRQRIVQFVAALETEHRHSPAPFVRRLHGDSTHLPELVVHKSESVSTAAATGECILGVFYAGSTLKRGTTVKLANYTGWLLTAEEYNELNDAAHENMNALYGFEVKSLTTFVDAHFKDDDDDAGGDKRWKGATWVVLGDPVTMGANVNTPGRATRSARRSGWTLMIPQRTNVEFHINTDSNLKQRRRDGRYAVSAELVTMHKRLHSAMHEGDELFVAYDRLLAAKRANSLESTNLLQSL